MCRTVIHCAPKLGRSQRGKAAGICRTLVKIFASCLSLLDLSLWDILCTSHLMGGRLSNMSNFGQCNVNGSDSCHFQAHVLRLCVVPHPLLFACTGTPGCKISTASFPWVPAWRRHGAEPKFSPEQREMEVRNKSSVWSANSDSQTAEYSLWGSPLLDCLLCAGR